MRIRELGITGVFEITPQIHADERGAFLESFRADELATVLGHPFTLAQANTSVSAAGTLRGIHFAQLPPSQAKYVTCLRRAAFDVVVDIRVDSRTYGQWEGIRLDDRSLHSVYVGEGLGHAFMALADDTVVSYLCSAAYAPSREHGIDPLDPVLGIAWPDLEPRLSAKDRAAPSLAEARAAGSLPSQAEVDAYLATLLD